MCCCFSVTFISNLSGWKCVIKRVHELRLQRCILLIFLCTSYYVQTTFRCPTSEHVISHMSYTRPFNRRDIVTSARLTVHNLPCKHDKSVNVSVIWNKFGPFIYLKDLNLQSHWAFEIVILCIWVMWTLGYRPFTNMDHIWTNCVPWYFSQAYHVWPSSSM